MEHFYFWGKAFTQNCNNFGRIWVLLNRRAELRRLKRWATRKGLNIPTKLYTSRLLETERLLLHVSLDSPTVASLAYGLHPIKTLLIRPPKYLAKGSARAYRRTWLTP